MFGPDEMEVLDGTILYNPALVSVFRTKKGYDPIPYLVGLFHDIGPKTEKIRGDCYETMVSLVEENWHRPIPQWLHDHGMKYADFCPRGKDYDFLMGANGDVPRRMERYLRKVVFSTKSEVSRNTDVSRIARRIPPATGQQRQVRIGNTTQRVTELVHRLRFQASYPLCRRPPIVFCREP